MVRVIVMYMSVSYGLIDAVDFDSTRQMSCDLSSAGKAVLHSYLVTTTVNIGSCSLTQQV